MNLFGGALSENVVSIDKLGGMREPSFYCFDTSDWES